MKGLWFFPLLLLVTACSSSKNQFELTANQSMLIIGKGTGQDAAINPYADQVSIAEVRNKGEAFFYVRIQNGDQFLSQTPIMPGETREFELQPGFRLYLDSEKASKSEIRFMPK